MNFDPTSLIPLLTEWGLKVVGAIAGLNQITLELVVGLMALGFLDQSIHLVRGRYSWGSLNERISIDAISPLGSPASSRSSRH